MVRGVLFGLLALTALSCSSKDDTAAKVEPATVAGTVVEVTGKVTIGTKTLTVGDPLAADDLVDTGTDGDVVIELAHNQVRWEVGPNKQVRASASPAWNLPRKQLAARVDQDTSAAGRPAERSAADTSINVKPAPAPGAPAPAPMPTPTAAATPPPTLELRAHASPSPPPPPPPPPPPSLEPSDHIVGNRRAPAARPPMQVPTVVVEALAVCLDPGTSIVVTSHVTNGIPVLVFPSGLSAKVKDCLDKASQQVMSLLPGEITFTLKRPPA